MRLKGPCAHVGVFSPIFVNCRGNRFQSCEGVRLQPSRDARHHGCNRGAAAADGGAADGSARRGAKKNFKKKKREIEPPITKIVKMQF